MIPKDCDDCNRLKDCSKRYHKTSKVKKTFCADGKSRLLEDSVSAIESTPDEYVEVNELKCIKP